MLADTTKRDIQRESTNPYCVMISSFHVMIPSFHAVFVLWQRDKSAKVIDYKDSDYLLVSFGDEDCCRMYSRISAVSSGWNQRMEGSR